MVPHDISANKVDSRSKRQRRIIVNERAFAVVSFFNIQEPGIQTTQESAKACM